MTASKLDRLKRPQPERDEEEEVKACWMVLLPNRAPFAMVGAQTNRDEALACARIIWPEADVA